MISFMITNGSWKFQGMIMILKWPGHDISGKHLWEGYCIDVT